LQRVWEYITERWRVSVTAAVINRRHFLALGAGAGFAVLAACGSGSSAGINQATGATPQGGSPKRGGTYVVTQADLTVGGDPMVGGTGRNALFTACLNGIGNLVRFDRQDNYKVVPGLAESWENDPTSTQWTFKIRDNAKWHDGTPF